METFWLGKVWRKNKSGTHPSINKRSERRNQDSMYQQWPCRSIASTLCHAGSFSANIYSIISATQCKHIQHHLCYPVQTYTASFLLPSANIYIIISATQCKHIHHHLCYQVQTYTASSLLPSANIYSIISATQCKHIHHHLCYPVQSLTQHSSILQ
jgi:cytochrome oxidase assembly protein ShyY1